MSDSHDEDLLDALYREAESLSVDMAVEYPGRVTVSRSFLAEMRVWLLTAGEQPPSSALRAFLNSASENIEELLKVSDPDTQVNWPRGVSKVNGPAYLAEAEHARANPGVWFELGAHRQWRNLQQLHSLRNAIVSGCYVAFRPAQEFEVRISRRPPLSIDVRYVGEDA